MAKKVRRAKKKQKKSRSTTGRVDTGVTDAVTEAPQLTSAEQFRSEYAYVVKDLRRVLILAAVMFALLIALNLLLQ